jgi:hypothetical protein
MAGLIVVGLLLATIYVLAFLLVAQTARNKGRDPVFWILLALIISPLGALILNWLLPPSNGGGPPFRGAGT